MTTPVAENLFIHEGRATRLIAGRHSKNGTFRFPFPAGRDAEAYERIELSPRGRLWSFTVQRFRPKPPFDGDGEDGDFRPFAVGYVELPGELIVESRIVVEDFTALQIGEPMHITSLVYRHDEGGAPISTFAFEPEQEKGA